MVLFYLPDRVQRAAPEKEKETPASDVTAAMSAEQVNLLRDGALSARERWYEKKAEAELENMPVYAGHAFSMAEGLGKRGAELFSMGSFEEAARNFNDASEIIEKAHDSRQDILHSAIESGEQALEAGNATAAMRFFHIALSVDPADPAALKGLNRAEHAGEVHGLMAQGKELMKEKDYHGASKLFSRALAIDPECGDAERLLEQATRGASQQQFARFMGDAIAALSAGRYGDAARAIDGALRLFPGDRSARELSARIREARRASELRLAISRADRALRQEDWKRAEELYAGALKIAPHSVEAGEGLERAKRLMSLHKMLKRIVDDPWRLRDAGPYEDAVNAVNIARKTHDAGPGLRRLAAEAGSIVERWKKKVSVTFVSDSKTSVVIYHVGRLGRFERRILKLRPGIYTVAGMREGFRDVLRKIKVAPGSDGMEVKVVCSDRI